MKNSLLLYLFIIILLLNVFTYMYFSKQLTFVKDKSAKTEAKWKKDLEVANAKLVDANYFSLEKNENAQNYFNPDNATKTIQVEKLIPVVTEKLMDLNANPEGNPFVGQDQIGANKFIINKVRILNHRWIIAEFSNGDLWGQILVKYFVAEGKPTDFETVETVLYERPTKE